MIEASLINIDGERRTPRPINFTEGTHTLEYEAIDESGNRAVMILQLVVSGKNLTH